MKIIDRKTGERIADKEIDGNNQKRNRQDPIKRFVEKGLEKEDEISPMDPPEAYDIRYTLGDISYDDMTGGLQMLMDEHQAAIAEIETFEKALVELKENGFSLTRDLENTFSGFFKFFDNNILAHNRKEEKFLFPLLHEKLIASGEHGIGNNPNTAVDLMEDDHIKFIQLATLTFNLLGLATRLPEINSRALTFDLAYNSGRELIEMLRLHIFREDKTLFPLAQKLIDNKEFSVIEKQLNQSNE